MIISHAPQHIANWVCAQRGVSAPAVDVAFGYTSNGRLKAGIYFDGATGNNIFAHITSVGPVLPRGLLRAAAEFVYVSMCVDRMTLLVPDDHSRLKRFVEGMGAELECSMSNAADVGVDLLVYVLWKDTPFIERLLRKE